jgi:hypothetical protein
LQYKTSHIELEILNEPEVKLLALTSAGLRAPHTAARQNGVAHGYQTRPAG